MSNEEEVEYVKKYIGTEILFETFLKNNKTTKQDREKLQWGFEELSKSHINHMFINDAYNIIHRKTNQQQEINTGNNASEVMGTEEDIKISNKNNNLIKNEQVARHSADTVNNSKISIVGLLRITIPIIILILIVLYFNLIEQLPTPTSETNTIVQQPKNNITCNEEEIENTVKKLAIDLARRRLSDIDLLQALHITDFERVFSSFNNITYVTMTSIYPTNINRELNIIECRGDIDIYTTKISNIPISVKYKAQYNEYGQGYVEIIDFKFRSRYFVY